MDVTNFIDTTEELYKAAEGDSKLKRIRENRGLSQTGLAEQSGVNLRNIQMYEQRGNDIDKAQARILYKLSNYKRFLIASNHGECDTTDQL